MHCRRRWPSSARHHTATTATAATAATAATTCLTRGRPEEGIRTRCVPRTIAASTRISIHVSLHQPSLVFFFSFVGVESIRKSIRNGGPESRPLNFFFHSPNFFSPRPRETLAERRPRKTFVACKNYCKQSYGLGCMTHSEVTTFFPTRAGRKWSVFASVCTTEEAKKMDFNWLAAVRREV